MINIEQNWTELKSELQKVKRDGIDSLIKYIEETDFKTCPASTKFHLCVEGGLTQHSLNVLKYGRLVNKELNVNISDDSIILSCLLHDLCKTNYYYLGEEWDKKWKDETNQWRKKSVWKVEDKLPLGHGERSVIQAVRHIDLTPEEMIAIRWHMAAFDGGTHFNYPSGLPFRQAMNECPLLKVLILADEMAELHESLEVKE